jgi:uncharacterized protein YlxW (UPF0749 family)
MKNVSLDQVLLVASFLGIAYSPFYVLVFGTLVLKAVVLRTTEKKDDQQLQGQLKKELERVQAVSAQIEELQNSINNVRAAVSLGGRR